MIERVRRVCEGRFALTVLALLVAAVFASSVLLASGVAQSAPSKGKADVGPKWKLKYQESFGKPLNGESEPWIKKGYDDPLHNLREDSGDEWRVRSGPSFDEALNSFDTYRKSLEFGRDGWLTAELSARASEEGKGDSFNDPSKRPSVTTETLPGAGRVAKIDVPSHTGGAIIRSTKPLPEKYRIEYDLKTIDFGGKRNGTLEYDGKINGYDKEGCKTLHPWQSYRAPEGTTPYCDWLDMRSEGGRAYNQFHFLSILDTLPVPQNNGFPHFHRKIMMDAFNPYPPRGDNYRVCNSDTGEYYPYKESNRNTINMLFLGRQTGGGTAPNNDQMFVSSCEKGSISGEGAISAAEMQPELMPKEDYTFAIERSGTSYTMEVSGNFKHVGEETYRFTRDFLDEDRSNGTVENNTPIWHYNVTPDEYDGRFNSYAEVSGRGGTVREDNVWPEGSAYPDYFFIGDEYTNVSEGDATVDNIRLYVPKK